MKRILLALLIIIILGGVFVGYYKWPSEKLQTYFTYAADELEPLHKLETSTIISDHQLQKWDTIVFTLVKENKLGDAFAARIYAYLYVAQHDFAYLSYNLKGKFYGNIDAVSANVLCDFFAEQCNDIRFHDSSDSYSKMLAQVIQKKLVDRMRLDDAHTKNYPALVGKLYWVGMQPYFGQGVGSWQTWGIKSSDQFRAPAPPTPDNVEWQNQLKMTKTALANVTSEQTKSIVFWAGNPGTITPPGQWLLESNNYLWKHNVNLKKVLLVRAVLAMGIADAVMTVFDSKYTYWIRRPNMLDPNIHTIMPTPNHPSYPAGHATISSAASTILSHFFPDNVKYWQLKEYEASMSRVWGGIHFMIDTQVGNKLGNEVGIIEIKRLK